MADTFPLFAFTSQEDWYGELPFLNADANNAALSLDGRVFEMALTPATQGASVEAVKTLTMAPGGGLSWKTTAADGVFVFRIPRAFAQTLARGDYTADLLEVVDGERRVFLPVRIRYSEPVGLLNYVSRILGVAVTFASRQQPIVTPFAVAGRQGKRGYGFLTGHGGPGRLDGDDGDYWIDADTDPRLLYGPKVNGAWPAQTAIITSAVTAGLLTARDVAAQAALDAKSARDRAEAASGVVTGDLQAKFEGLLPGLPVEPPDVVGRMWLNNGTPTITTTGVRADAQPTPQPPIVHLVTSDELDAHKRLTRALSFAFH